MSTALTFFLAMLLHPDVQRKAQAEINAVVGMERLPTVSDKAELPYIRSIVTEVIRWNPALPFGNSFPPLHVSGIKVCLRSSPLSHKR